MVNPMLCIPCAPRLNSPQWYVKQPTWRLWGEEKVTGAIYSVYLKKVRYHRPSGAAASVTSNPYDNDEISHLEWETVRVRFVKAATLKKLVEALASDDGELESTYINVFLATYRTFSNAKEVLTLLLQRYHELLADNVLANVETLDLHRKTLISALHVWLDSYPDDFRTPPYYHELQQIIEFALKSIPTSELIAKARQKLDAFKCEQRKLYASNTMLYCATPNNLCLRNGMQTCQAFEFPHVPVRHFAEQLTRMDMELFKKLVPHQCLGAIWSRRDKSHRGNEAATVVATVNQFNAVSFRVISTILVDTSLKTMDRAAIIACWIDIAQELRLLKNFSSLKAIVCGLQSNSVYRLHKTWHVLAKEKMELFEELARIFSEDNNQWTQRDLLMREGTAKFADTYGQKDKQLQKVLQKQYNVTSSFGTIPYLGTFLTDLTMIDTAIPDYVGDGLINFDKRRKEFEVLAQIKLLQGAANAYNIEANYLFERWFDSVLVLDDKEAYELSLRIERNNKSRVATNGASTSKYHRKNDSITSTSSSNSSQFYCDLDGSNGFKHSKSMNNLLASRLSDTSGSTSSLPSLDVSLTSHGSNKAANGACSPNKSISTQGDFYIIKVTYETDHVERDGIVLYKSIMLSNNERTPQVIRNAMMKLCLDGNADEYTLAQVLPDKELTFPANANVYYAVNTAYNLNFILRPKKDEAKASKKGKK